MQNWTNDSSVFFLAMTILLIALQSEWIRKAAENACDWIDEKGDELAEEINEWGFGEQDFNK